MCQVYSAVELCPVTPDIVIVQGVFLCQYSWMQSGFDITQHISQNLGLSSDL